MTQLLLPTAPGDTVAEHHHSNASLRQPSALSSRIHAADLLPQLLAYTSDDAPPQRPACSSTDDFNPAWQNSLRLHDTIDYRRLPPPSHCNSVDADTSGQSVARRSSTLTDLVRFCHAAVCTSVM